MLKEEIIQTFEERAQKIKDSDNSKIFLEEQRKKLLANAEGKVLEVAVGRGVNFSFYPPSAEIVAVDFSPSLLKMAEETARKNNLQAEFINSDVEKLDFKDNSFDTIVSTLTICSYDNPVEVLNNFNKWCKPGGQILILEHGISSSKSIGWLINKLFSTLNDWHMKKRGCHLNTDILKIVRQSDIKVEWVETCLIDTHYLIWGKPNKF